MQTSSTAAAMRLPLNLPVPVAVLRLRNGSTNRRVHPFVRLDDVDRYEIIFSARLCEELAVDCSGTEDKICTSSAGRSKPLGEVLSTTEDQHRLLDYAAYLLIVPDSGYAEVSIRCNVNFTGTSSTMCEWLGCFDGEGQQWCFVVRRCTLGSAALPVPSAVQGRGDWSRFWDIHSTGSVVLSDDSFRILHVNQQLERLLGYSAGELIGRCIHELSPFETLGRCIHHCNQTASAPMAHMTECYHVSNGGQLMCLQWHVSRGDTQQYWNCMCRDISEHRQLQIEQRSLRNFWYTSSELFVVVDTASGRILDCNHAFEALIGLSLAELQGCPFADLVHPSDQCVLDSPLVADIPQECRMQISMHHVHDSGQKQPAYRWVRWTCKREASSADHILPSCDYLLGCDITVQKDAEVALRKTDRQKSLFLSLVGEHIRTPVHAIRGSCQILTLDDRLRALPDVADALQVMTCSSDELMLIFDNVITFAGIVSGSLSFVEEPVDLRKVSNAALEFMRFLVMRRATPSAASVQQHSAIRPLCFISENVPRLLEADRERLSLVLRNLWYVAIQQCTTIGFPPGSSLSMRIDASTVRSNQDKMPVKLKQQPTCDHEDGSTQLNATTVPTCMHIELAGLPCETDNWHVETITVIEDDGPSDPQGFMLPASPGPVASGVEELRRLSAAQLSNSQSLFLAVVKSLAKATGGNMRIEVQPLASSGGTRTLCDKVRIATVYVDFHVHTDPKAQSSLSVDPLSSRPLPLAPIKMDPISWNIPSRKIRILCADDDMINQRVLGAMFRKLGLMPLEHYVFVDNGRLAVERFQTEPTGFDLILLDLRMPHMDGSEACRHMRCIEAQQNYMVDEERRVADGKRRLPMIAISASVLEEDRAEALSSGFDSFMSKPITIAVLRDIIRDAQPTAKSDR